MKPTPYTNIGTGRRQLTVSLAAGMLGMSGQSCATALADDPLPYAKTAPFTSEEKSDTHIDDSDPLGHELRVWQDFGQLGCYVMSSELRKFYAGYRSEVLANMSAKDFEVRIVA